MAVALDQQFKMEKKGIIEERIAVLSPSGMEQHYFVTYVPLPTNPDDEGAIELWTERMSYICDDLTWLLQQNHAKFWCEASFNKDFHSMLDSYLRYAPRPQRTIKIDTYSMIANSKELEEKVSRLMFMCILRLSTHKESSDNFFTPQGFGHVIYDNYIFDIPRLFDICSLYAINNKELLSKMIGNIFKQQPRYSKDLQDAIKSIKDVIAKRIKVFHTSTGPKKINTTTTGKTSGVDEIVDLLYYILDLTSTINRFCYIYPQGRDVFFHENFHTTLIELFETFLRIYERTKQANDMFEYLELLEETKYETITLFNDLLTSCCIDPLVVNEDKSASFESLINIFSFLITEKRFLAAYEDYFSLDHIIDLVQQTTKLLDDEQIKFYTDAVKQAIELHGTPSCKQKLSPTSKASSTNNVPVKKSTNPNVQMIQDLFPHLNENYIEACLNHYNNNTEQLVNALFDNTVPENLKFEKTSTASISISTNETEKPFVRKETSLLEQRANIYDNDEFDIFNRENVDLTRIHRGKRARDLPADLNDKAHLEGMSERYARLGIVEDETDGDYDDEYDDTYDDGIVNVKDNDDPIDNELAKNENRLLGKQPGHYRRQSDEDEEEEDDENQVKRRNQFVENPEVVRERQAQQRAAWQQRHQPHRSHAEQQHDVVGNARGRGQSSAVSYNRRWKDAHKSSNANHNRRNRAAQKANRGLLS